ncbi:GNAT family N-acetyltransferase [Devosia sp. 63-57]|uniref:GNAT family N-acetyltransferase n=1 Tax=Devosia sp. 63-57 TaxID=1895751 RepID=UPI00086974A6|nr:GNAT family N-acetyltransferase [Devosia sp. 63-57]ODT50655.1 MAG: GNAT family N-acetyltransferase [Pelagibacterium sp. SCN 63-126]ODU85255.1 MAG: GNAT family N-acetyltransferase [Pelagibacterium sp. SCN 63-17]OJX45398.1 MAG: GNAT family N-acetyltransferase [Devosia sp. 63-57]
MSLAIRAAQPGDAGLILDFIKALAEYEKLSHEVVASADDLERDLFGVEPKVFCEIAEWAGKPVGFALWFYTYSTFQGRHGIWLEDLYVDPSMRGKGIGKALLVHLAQRCVQENLGRFEWWVLDWNEPSITFYKSQGGVMQDEWTKVRIDGAALAKLGAA